MNFFIYKTSKNERWDMISYKAYGTPYNTKVIIEANPHIRIEEFLPEDIEIKVPVLNKNYSAEALLPPWKRGKND